MKPVLTFALVCAAGCLLPFTTNAQTLYGPGGLLIHPTALTPKRGEFSLSASWFSQHITGQRSTEWAPLGLSYGVSDRLEIGALYADRLRANGLRRGSGGLFIRDQLLPEKANRPAVALSASYLGSDVLLASVAGTASYHFRQGARTMVVGHAGVQWGWRGDGIPASDAVSLFLGAEIPFGKGFSVLGEYGTRFAFDYKERSSLGLMWRSSRGVSVAVGLVNVGRSSENRFFVGVGVPLGGNK